MREEDEDETERILIKDLKKTSRFAWRRRRLAPGRRSPALHALPLPLRHPPRVGKSRDTSPAHRTPGVSGAWAPRLVLPSCRSNVWTGKMLVAEAKLDCPSALPSDSELGLL